MPTDQTAEVSAASTGGAQECVQALFGQEVMARQAVGLLVFHGFRADAIAVQAAAGTRWRRLRQRSRSRVSRRSGRIGAGALLGVGAGVLAVGTTGLGRFLLPQLLLVVGAGAIGAGVVGVVATPMLGRATSPIPEMPPADAVLPDAGCVVAVRTLRGSEARVVLGWAGGVLVVPDTSGAGDVHGHG